MTLPSALRPSAAALAELERDFATRAVALADTRAQVAVRECGSGPVLVLLHGIGSGSASWHAVAKALSSRLRVIAWDAPGYGASTPLDRAAPSAHDYAGRLHALLDALGIARCTLVGHSLGALVAAAAATRTCPRAARFDRVILFCPARGYGSPAAGSRNGPADVLGRARAATCEQVRNARFGALAERGIEGIACDAPGRLLSAAADDDARRWVAWNMARLNADGYRQAIEMLCADDLLEMLPTAPPVRVVCAAQDIVTPPSACEPIARACGVALECIERSGHACHAERPLEVARLIEEHP
ncbi:MAG: alpha/beta fold hydrolase [Lautropia sp.]